jgi:hypothetical protein
MQPKVGEKEKTFVTSKSLVKHPVGTKDLARIMNEKSLSCSSVSSQVRYLAGRILTIIDAAFPIGDQRKAIKDLIRNEVADTLGHITSLTLGNRELIVTDEEADKIVKESGEKLEDIIN